MLVGALNEISMNDSTLSTVSGILSAAAVGSVFDLFLFFISLFRFFVIYFLFVVTHI